MMIIFCLFGTRKNSPPTEDHNIIPELMVAWDEYCVEENPEGFSEDCDRAKISWGSELADCRVVEIKVKLSDIQAVFAQPSIRGEIVR